MEFALLTPVYAALLMGLLYLGGLSLARVELVRTAMVMAGTPGRQTAADLPPGAFGTTGALVFAGQEAHLTVEDDDDGGVNHTAASILQEIEEVAHDPIGYYVFRDGRLEYVRDDDRLSPWGAYIEAVGLRDESGRIADILNGWLARTTASGSFSFRMPFADYGTRVMQAVQTATVPLDRDRGTHPPAGAGGLGAAVVGEMFGAAMPEGDPLTLLHAVPR